MRPAAKLRTEQIERKDRVADRLVERLDFDLLRRRTGRIGEFSEFAFAASAPASAEADKPEGEAPKSAEVPAGPTAEDPAVEKAAAPAAEAPEVEAAQMTVDEEGRQAE